MCCCRLRRGSDAGSFIFRAFLGDQDAAMSAIEVDGLTKRFGDFVAVDQVRFNVEDGEIFGLLGPNGAGKTTLIRMLTTLTPPTDGSARVAGHDVRKDADGVRN